MTDVPSKKKPNKIFIQFDIKYSFINDEKKTLFHSIEIE